MIKKIYYENFKGFEKAEMPIECLTTLIGTNASGKSNAVEGLKILSELMTGRELSTILDGSKNMDSSIRGGSRGCCRFNSSSFCLGCLVQYDDAIDLKYMVEIKVADRTVIGLENLYKVDYREGEPQLLFATQEMQRSSEEVKVLWNCNTGAIKCSPFSAIISQIVAKLPQEEEEGKRIIAYCRKVIENLKTILFLNPDPSSMRGYAKINDSEMKVSAENLSSVLYKLCKNNLVKNTLLEIMRQLPENEIVDISFSEGPLNDVILFLNESYGNRTEKIDATRLSDGTLRCLAVMAALLSEKEQSMIVIEEVDNGIHPGRAKKMLQTISEISQKRKIDVLITTHNAIMLNALSKEDLIGVDIVYRNKDSGASMFKALTSIEKMHELLANGKLGDVVTNGMILDYIKEPVKDLDRIRIWSLDKHLQAYDETLHIIHGRNN